MLRCESNQKSKAYIFSAQFKNERVQAGSKRSIQILRTFCRFRISCAVGFTLLALFTKITRTSSESARLQMVTAELLTAENLQINRWAT